MNMHGHLHIILTRIVYPYQAILMYQYLAYVDFLRYICLFKHSNVN